MTADKRYYRLSVLIHASEEEMRTMEQSISSVLCDDPEHPPPCRVPWLMEIEEPAHDDNGVRFLSGQVEAERSPPRD